VLDFLVFTFIFVRPDIGAGHGIEAVNTFGLSRDCYPVSDVNPAASDGWPAVAVGDFGAPPDIKPWSIEFVDNALFRPDAIPAGTSPLGPIRALGWNCQKQAENRYQCQFFTHKSPVEKIKDSSSSIRWLQSIRISEAWSETIEYSTHLSD
jgi:hypothetical protein